MSTVDITQITRAIERDFRRAQELPTFEGRLVRTRVEVKAKTRGSGTYSGTAYPAQNRVILRFGETKSEADRQVVLLHELTHLVTPGQGHNEVFIARLYEAASEFFGAFFEPDWATRRQGRSNRSYAMEQLHLIPLARDWARRKSPNFPVRYQVFERQEGRQVIHNFTEVERQKAKFLSDRLKDLGRDGRFWDTRDNSVSRALRF